MHTTSYKAISWPGYGLGALPSDQAADVYVTSSGNTIVTTRCGTALDCHPLVRKAGGYGSPEFNAPAGVYPIRFAAYGEY